MVPESNSFGEDPTLRNGRSDDEKAQKEELGISVDFNVLPETVREMIVSGPATNVSEDQTRKSLAILMAATGYTEDEIRVTMSDPTNAISKRFFEAGAEDPDHELVELIVGEFEHVDVSAPQITPRSDEKTFDLSEAEELVAFIEAISCLEDLEDYTVHQLDDSLYCFRVRSAG